MPRNSKTGGAKTPPAFFPPPLAEGRLIASYADGYGWTTTTRTRRGRR